MQLRIGEDAVVDGVNKRWAGQNYGWQSTDVYDELEQQGKLRWGQQAVDRIYQNLGNGLKNGANALLSTLPEEAQKGIRATNTAIADGAVTFIGDVAEGKYDAGVGGEELQPSRLLRDIGTVVQTIDDATEFVSEKTNISKDLIELAPDAIGLVASAGSSTAVKTSVKAAGKLALDAADELIDAVPARQVLQPALADGAIRLPKAKEFEPSNTFQITMSPRYRAPGAVEGIADEYPEVAINAEKAFRKYDPNTPGGLRKRNEYLSHSPDFKNKPFDPIAYYKHVRGSGMNMNEFRRLDKESGRWMEQHHLFPVGESGPFMERMHMLNKAGIGDADDPVAMMMYADFVGASMGHRWSNMLNMHKIPHLKTHAEDLVVESKLLREKLAKIDTVDGLMEEMHNHLIDRILPAKGNALDNQIKYLQENPGLQPKLLEEAMTLRDAFKEQIKPKQLNAIDEYIEALKLRGA